MHIIAFFVCLGGFVIAMLCTTLSVQDYVVHHQPPSCVPKYSTMHSLTHDLGPTYRLVKSLYLRQMLVD